MQKLPQKVRVCANIVSTSGRQMLVMRIERNDVRSISRMNKVLLDWFMPSHGVIVIRPVFSVLCCEI
jgi:hypothetical protein